MRGEGAGKTHGGNKRRKRHRLGKSWRKYRGKMGGGDVERGTRSRGRGETTREGERGFGYDGTETGDGQVGR